METHPIKPARIGRQPKNSSIFSCGFAAMLLAGSCLAAELTASFKGLVLTWNPYQPTITQAWPVAYPVKQKKGYELKKAPSTTVTKEVHEGWMVTEPFPWEAARRLTTEYKRIRHLFYGDFYPLTPYSSAAEDWMAYQCHREDLRQGAVVAFRRSQCVREQARLELWGLDTRSRYEVRNEDTGKTITKTGKELAEGLDVTITDQPGSQLITYRQVP